MKIKLLLSSLLAIGLFPGAVQAQNNLLWAGENSSWDLRTLNWLLGADRTNFNQGDHVIFDQTATNFTPSLAITITPASVTLNGTSDYTLSGPGNLSGATGITKNGSGTFSLTSAANDYTGPVAINEGVFRAGTTSALGTGDGSTTVAAGATLNISGQNLVTEPIFLQGAGTDGTNGAVNNTGGQQQNALRFVTLLGDTTLNASNARWDIGNAGTPGGLFAGGGFTLTKIGAQPIFLKDVGETALGDIKVNSGILGFQHNITMGDPEKTATVTSPGELIVRRCHRFE